MTSLDHLICYYLFYLLTIHRFSLKGQILNTELEKVNMWLKANKLTINIKKTHYMMFHRTRIKHNTNIKIVIDNNIVDHINNTKFLGVIIDSKLNWAAHILDIKSKILKYIGILLKLRIFLQNKYVFHFHLPIPNLLYRSLGKCSTYAFRSVNKNTEKSIRTIIIIIIIIILFQAFCS